MKAIVYDSYGPFEALAVREIAQPAVEPGEVLVRVRAAALHVGDVFSVRGSPFMMRLATGLRKPKYGVPGFDLAGEVAATGKNVTRFRPGDAVFGACHGSCAEFARTSAEELAPKPEALDYVQAAALPTSGLAALHALRDVAKLQRGQTLLINGAAGGIGTFAVQIAKSYGAEVSGVCSTRNVELVRSLGADHVIDYTREDFTQRVGYYDVILDNVENRSLTERRRALRPKGMLICNSGTGAHGLPMLIRLLKPLVLSPFVRHELRRYLSTPNAADLSVLGELVQRGVLKPVIDRTYTLDDTPAALAHIESGHARGKVVVQL